MRKLFVIAKGRVEIRDVPKPLIPSGGARLKNILASICGTDVHFVDDEELFPGIPKPYPFSLGHEFVGEIEAMDKDFPKTDAYGMPLKKGDRVVFYGSDTACGNCYFCKTLMSPHLCMRRELSNLGGAFADYIIIPRGSTVFKVPDTLPLDIAVLSEPLSGALRSVERAFTPGIPDRAQGIGPGKTAVVQGSGAMGVLITAVLKFSGLHTIIVIGAPDMRLRICKQMGATKTINVFKTGFKERLDYIKSQTPFNTGADCVFEAAGVPEAFLESLEYARKGGTVIELAHWTLRKKISFNPMNICIKDLAVYGVVGYPPHQFGIALRILDSRQNEIPFKKMITHEVSLDDIEKGFEIMRSQECMKVLVRF